MKKDNYHPYSGDELEKTMAAGGDIFREDEEEEKKPELRLVEGVRGKLRKKEAK